MRSVFSAESRVTSIRQPHIALRVCGLAALLLAVPLTAQEPATSAAPAYPSKRITLVVPNTAGGAIDVAARILSPKLSEYLGQQIVVENRVAAGGVLATNQVALAAPDGYTLLAVFDSFVTNPHLFSGVQYDPVKSFAPVALVIRTPQVLIVHPSLPARTVKELVALAKSKGPALTHATAGPGTSSRLSFELFKEVAGFNSVAVHYKGGAPALIDVLGGHVPVMIIQLGGAIQHVKEGKLVALAVSSAKRSPLLPSVPAISETYRDFEAQSWVGVLAPAGTPPGVVQRLNAAVAKALATSEVRERYFAQGSEVVASTPEAFAGWIRSESAKWSRVIRERKITLD
jgi:tripartite-type tricarboxylate transporter receptor subunit TctC